MVVIIGIVSRGLYSWNRMVRYVGKLYDSLLRTLGQNLRALIQASPSSSHVLSPGNMLVASFFDCRCHGERF